MEMDSGWIKIHRKILSWEWYMDTNTKVVFLHLLIKANHEEKNYKGNIIGVGECLTSVASLSKELNLSIKQVRTALNHLKKGKEVSVRTANGEASGASIVKLCNYAVYQYNGSDEGQALGQAKGKHLGEERASEGQAKGKDGATPKELKELEELEELEEEKKDIPVPDGTESDFQKPKDVKHRYGEYNHVFLTDAERDRLFNEFGEANTLEAIRYLDEYIEMKGYKSKSHNLAIRKWVLRAVEEEKRRNKSNDPFADITSWVNSRTAEEEQNESDSVWGIFGNN